VLAFAALTTLLAVWGPVRVVKQFRERFVVWLVLGTTLWITAAIAASYDLGELLRRPGTGELPFLVAVDLVVALPISWFPLVADYSRLSRDRASAFWGTGLGYFVPHVWFYALGAMLALGGGVAFDPNAPVAPLIAAIAGLTVGWVALLVLLVDEVDEGFANIYSTAVSLQNISPGLSQRAASLAIGALVLVLAELVPLVQYESFLLLIGSLFVPLFGVLAADYFLLRRGRYAAASLFERRGEYWYAGGVHWMGVACWLVGVATYLAIGGIPPLGVAGLIPWLGATLPSLVLSFALYAALGSTTISREVCHAHGDRGR
jgi:NCS1 family nucleobase:cation symporter-1